MPDITMCNGLGCPHKEQCYRFTAEPNEFRQSYFFNSPIKDDKCDYYWENEIKNKTNEQSNNRI